MSLTIATISAVNLELTEFSVKQAQKVLPYSETLVFTNNPINTDSNHVYHKIEDNFNRAEYSIFCMKKLVDYIKTDFVCLVQYDGIAVNKDSWDDSFYDYDYIGSLSNLTDNGLVQYPFTKKKFIKAGILKNFVGGGGFSLRSKKLLEALQDKKFKSYCTGQNPVTGKSDYYFCEDVFISILYRKKLEKRYGIKFAPKKIAKKFCSEFFIDEKSLGFHGFYNFPIFFSEADCMYYFSLLDRRDFRKNFKNFDVLLKNARIKQYNELVDFLEKKL